MKKLFLTFVICSISLFSFSQNFLTVTTVTEPGEGEEWGTTNFTENLGIAYKVADNCFFGIVKNGEDYDLYSRYLWKENVFVTVQAPTEEVIDNMELGLGYSINVWNGLCFEHRYNVGLKENENGDREGAVNFGLSYTF